MLNWTSEAFARLNLPKFCRECGMELEFLVERTGLFDIQTGKKLVWYSVRCPSKRNGWWLFQDRHTAKRDDFMRYADGE